VVADRARDADAAGSCQPFQPSGDVDAVSENVVAFGDDVAEIDADTKAQTALLGEIQIAFRHRALDFAGAAHRVDDAGEFRQHAVTGVLDDAAVMLADLRLDQFAQMRLEVLVRAFLVSAHKPRVAHHVSGEDCGETARGSHGPTLFLRQSGLVQAGDNEFFEPLVQDRRVPIGVLSD